MITQHESFQAPASPEISIWRYMDLTKFLWMLQRRALFFTRSDKLGDPFEGHYIEAITVMENELVQQLSRNGNDKIPEDAARQIVGLMRQSAVRTKEHLFVNCWHMNEHESSAMWRLYTSHHQSVCIKSSYRLLAELLPHSCMLGCVKYIDYRSDMIHPANLLNYINFKRRSYEHERELRAVIWDEEQETIDGVSRPKFCGESVIRSDEEIGKIVPIAVDKLITAVLVSPDSDDTLLEVAQGVCDRYEVPVKVTKSGVNAPPAY